MLIKTADDKQTDIAALEELHARRDVPDSTRRRIQDEIWSIRTGAKTEADAAYEIEFQFGKNKNVMTIHDLRLDVDGRVAQIDHLIINRFFDLWVCESKSFSGGVRVNEDGDWTTYRNGRPAGIASPIEQNKRHMRVLEDVFAKHEVDLPSRLGITLKPRLESLVLISNSGMTPTGRGKRLEGMDRVIKVERLAATIDQALDDRGTRGQAASIFKVVSSETIEKLARQLVALHQPLKFDWAAKFGLSSAIVPPSATAGELRNAVSEPMAGTRQTAAAAKCESCGEQVSEKVLAYCRDNAERFSGKILCYQCQRRRPAARAQATARTVKSQDA